MIVTEEEALTKVCSRVGGNASPNGDHQERPPMWPCVGSRCMAWRQSHVRKAWLTNDGNGKVEEWNWDVRTQSRGYAGYTVEKEIVEPHGFCGLAGKS